MPTTLEQIIARGESEQAEFKKSLSEVSKGVQAAVGMLNGLDGGVLLFGVRDDGTIVGVQIGHETHDRLRNEFRKIDPPFIPSIETHPVEGGRVVLVVRIPGNTDLYRYEGKPYIRFGASTLVMTEAQYRARFLEQIHARSRWETHPASMAVSDLDVDEINLTIATAISNGRLADPETRELMPLLRGLNLLDGNDRLLNAGAVLFGKTAAFQREYPQSRLRMARFRGGSKAEFVDNRQVVGNIFGLYQRAQEFLLEHIQIAGKLEEGKFERTDVPGYPLDALREALANALSHRDYTEGGGAVDLAIYDDRIEIVSSGTLHFGLTVESLLTDHQSRPWNPLIADVLYKRGVIESWGRGTVKMIESTRQVGLVSPEFESSPHSFTVRFRSREYMPPTRVSHDLTPLHREILACLQTLGPSNGREVGSVIRADVETKTLLRNLHALVEFGLVVKTGAGRGTKWFLAHGERDGS